MQHDANAETRAFLVFSHVNAEKAGLYRAGLRVFTEAKSALALHLRPTDVRSALAGHPLLDASDAGAVESALAQLCGWGNLEAHRDTPDVASAKEFYRPQFLYQLTSEGEAAKRAWLVFFETLRQPGELQTAALDDIRQHLGELGRLAKSDTPDESVVHQALHFLTNRFQQLTARAQIFLRSLHRTIDLHGVSIDAFLAHKQTLIDYLERFIGELVIATHEIAGWLREIESSRAERLLEAVARRDSTNALEHEKAARMAEALKLWRARWAGLRG